MEKDTRQARIAKDSAAAGIPMGVRVSVILLLSLAMAKKTPLEIEMLSRQMHELAQVINDKPDMECVLIVGGFLDQCLVSLLRRYFVKSETADNFLDFKKGNLGEFASRIKVCYCLGLITKEMLKNLEIIGGIRNCFGHTHLSLDFTNSEITTLCGRLTYPKIHQIVGGDGSDPFAQVHGSRNRFATIAFMLANRLLLTGLATTHRERLEQGWE